MQKTTHVLVKRRPGGTEGSLQFFDRTVSPAGLKQKMAHRPTTFNASSVTGNFFTLRYSFLLFLSFY